MRHITKILVISLLAAQVLAADSESNTQQGIESLGGQLLDDLTPNVAPPPTAPRIEDLNRKRSTPDNSGLPTEPRFDDLGEDIGQPSGPLSLVRVRQGMQQAEELLGHPAADAGSRAVEQAGAVQQEVVSQLDKLIAELSKQCQGGQCKPGDQPPKPSQRSQSKPGKSGKAAGSGSTAARDSTDRLDRSTAQPVEKGDIDALVKELWGHLPERSREQMLQSFSDEFLPKYELEIEQYYRRLSEEQDGYQPQ